MDEFEPLISLLESMGAENVKFHEAESELSDEGVSFEFDGKEVSIFGQWFQGGCAGICFDIEELND